MCLSRATGCPGNFPGRPSSTLGDEPVDASFPTYRRSADPGRRSGSRRTQWPPKMKATNRAGPEIVNRVVDSFGKLAGDRLHLAGLQAGQLLSGAGYGGRLGRRRRNRLPGAGPRFAGDGQPAGGLRNQRAAGSRYLVGAPQERTAGAPLPVLAAAANPGEASHSRPAPRGRRNSFTSPDAVVHGRGLAANSLTAAAAADPINATFRSDSPEAPDGTQHNRYRLLRWLPAAPPAAIAPTPYSGDDGAGGHPGDPGGVAATSQ